MKNLLQAQPCKYHKLRCIDALFWTSLGHPMDVQNSFNILISDYDSFKVSVKMHISTQNRVSIWTNLKYLIFLSWWQELYTLILWKGAKQSCASKHAAYFGFIFLWQSPLCWNVLADYVQMKETLCHPPSHSWFNTATLDSIKFTLKMISMLPVGRSHTQHTDSEYCKGCH